MSSSQGESQGQGAHQPATVLVSFLGAIVRRLGNWMPTGGTVELMAQLGLDAPATRSAVFRLKRRGWLAPESLGGARGYALTGQALKTLAAGDEIVWHARQPADLADGWCVVHFSVPEADSARRHQLRAHLSHLGFGNVGTAMWIAPARMHEAARDAVAAVGLDKHAAIFLGDYAGAQDLSALLYQSWDLTAINQRYRDFIAAYQEVAADRESAAVLDPGRAFVTYLTMISRWRRLPFRDPGLPRELLAADWSAPEAGALLERLVCLLEGRALAHASGYWPAPPRR